MSGHTRTGSQMSRPYARGVANVWPYARGVGNVWPYAHGVANVWPYAYGVVMVCQIVAEIYRSLTLLMRFATVVHVGTCPTVVYRSKILATLQRTTNNFWAPTKTS